MAKKKSNSYECNFHNEDGDKCTDEAVSCGYCEFHNPSLVIERMLADRGSKPAKMHVRTSSGKHSRVRHIDSSIANIEERFGVTQWNPRDDAFDAEEYWPQTQEEWAQFEKHYALDDFPPTSRYAGSSSTKYFEPLPKKPLVEFPVGKYRIIGGADPNDKKGKFHIPHMQFFVLRTKEGYRAVWVSHCGTGYKGSAPTLPLFNHHWSEAYEDFYDAESEFFRGGETPGKIKERISNVKDHKFLPPNTRNLATKGAWETLKLTGASDELIEKLKDWKDAGCPGWRTWDGKKFVSHTGSAVGYTYNSGFQDDKLSAGAQTQIEKWTAKYGFKK